MRGEVLQERQIVHHSFFIGRSGILSDIDANDAASRVPEGAGIIDDVAATRDPQDLAEPISADARAHPALYVGGTAAGESHPVDERFVFLEAKEARLWISWLREGRNRADLNMAEPEGGQPIDGAGVLS
jgi:hypothetical protein